MPMLKRLARLFTIKTRTEAWLIIYAIALGAVERARHYVEAYPGWTGWLLALLCTGVVFLAGAKLLDSVRRQPAKVKLGPHAPLARRRAPTRNRPRLRPARCGEGSPLSRRTD
ncbi:MAG TPA: hypothetical protein VM346_03240 [Sphingomicrobium sp.]|nr:hypothetical protein [Sphingomicrobium sp.]